MSDDVDDEIKNVIVIELFYHSTIHVYPTLSAFTAICGPREF